MAFYVLIYKTVENYIERRAPFREVHLAHAAKAKEQGLLVMGGAYADPPDGALLIFQCDDPGPVEEFAKTDPYVKNGLIPAWEVRKWTVVIGDE